jgi:hypothetical protein
MSRSGWTYAAVLAAAAAVVWLAFQARSAAPPEPRSSGAEAAPFNPPPLLLPHREVETTYVELTGDAGIAAGEGLLEVVMSAEAPIKVDGAPQGRGPRITLALKAGPHDVLLGAEDKPRSVEIRAGKKTRLDFPEPP